MSRTGTLRVVLVSILIVLVPGAGPGRLPESEAGSAGASAEDATATSADGSTAASADGSTATSAEPRPCPVLGPVLDIQVDPKQDLSPAVAYNPLHGEYLVVSTRSWGPLTAGIMAARVNGEGEVISSFSVVSGEAEVRKHPAVAYSAGQDQYLVVYVLEVSPWDEDVYASRVNWNGAWVSQEFPVRVDVDDQVWPSVAYNDQDDEFLVVYENAWAGGVHDIDAQTIQASNGARLEWRNVATGTNEERRWPDADYNMERNQYLIAYGWSGHGPGGQPRIRGKLAEADLDGLSAQPETHLCCGPAAIPQQWGAAVAAGPDEYLVTFNNGIINAPIYGRRVSHSGERLGPETGFPITQESPLPGAWSDLDFARTSYLAVWFATSTTGPLAFNVYGGLSLAGEDEAAGGDFTIAGSSQDEQYAALACAPHGDCLVVYEVGPSDASNYDIRGRFVRPCRGRIYLPLVRR